MTDPVSRFGGFAARRFSRVGALARFGFRALGSGRSLAGHGEAFTVANEADIRASVTNLAEASRQLKHFVAEMRRRPYRRLTGVKPVSPPGAKDTTRGGGARAASPKL